MDLFGDILASLDLLNGRPLTHDDTVLSNSTFLERVVILQIVGLLDGLGRFLAVLVCLCFFGEVLESCGFLFLIAHPTGRFLTILPSHLSTIIRDIN